MKCNLVQRKIQKNNTIMKLKIILIASFFLYIGCDSKKETPIAEKKTETKIEIVVKDSMVEKPASAITKKRKEQPIEKPTEVKTKNVAAKKTALTSPKTKKNIVLENTIT